MDVHNAHVIEAVRSLQRASERGEVHSGGYDCDPHVNRTDLEALRETPARRPLAITANEADAVQMSVPSGEATMTSSV
jgi:hypothetical protein